MLIVENCSFARNAGAATGPLNIATSRDYTSKVTNCTFYRNGRNLVAGEIMYTKGGGGICIEGGKIFVDNCAFQENYAVDAGGLMVDSLVAEVVVRGCHFYANQAIQGGGAISSTSSFTGVASSIFVGNRAANHSGVYANHTEGKAPLYPLDSCILIDNQSPAGSIGESALDNVPLITNSILDVDSKFNLFRVINAQPGVLYATPLHPSNLLSLNHSTIGFVRLPNDGGDGWGDDLFTPDIDEGANDDFGDLRLTPGSPAIDAGDNSDIPRDEFDFDSDGDTTEPVTGEFDIDGNPRFVDAPGMPNVYPGTSVGGPIDLGPYEYQSVSCWADVNADGMLSPADFSAWISAFNTNKPRANQNRDDSITPADFSAWIAGFNAGC